ncbi:MAG: ATP-binding protein [Bacteroidales bacterium]|nr:ATP-binding protein [Bacteroidales bacterium]
MWENLQIKRKISQFLPEESRRTLVMVTGARQTGKTTLVRGHYHELPYYNLDAVEYREQLGNISTFSWFNVVGHAVLDEVQKEPTLFDKIKYAFDEGSISFSVLTGSSQLLLLGKVRETLAGRIMLFELFPFMLSELMYPEGGHPDGITLEKLLSGDPVDGLLRSIPEVVLGDQWDLLQRAENRLITWGGMPPLIHISDEKERIFWLNDYSTAYLERDLSDLVRLNDLKPFRRFQRLASLRTSNMLHYSELAKDAGTSTETARRYIEYLGISYQAFLLQPYHINLTSTVVKTPKLYWYDNGLLRHLSGIGYDLDNGQLFENYVASELMKYLKTTRSNARLYYYRTRSGMEVDFILDTPSGIIAIEVKNRENISESDCSSLRRLASNSKKSIRLAMVVYKGNKLINFGAGLWAVPSSRLFS